MARPRPTYEFYVNDHRGRAGRDEFLAALPAAAARMREAVPADRIPARHRRAYLHAVCAMADRVAGVDERGRVSSETVGGTSVTYADAQGGSAFGDIDAVAPYLAGTGLLYRGIGGAR